MDCSEQYWPLGAQAMLGKFLRETEKNPGGRPSKTSTVNFILRTAGEDLSAWVFINEEGLPLDQHNFRRRVYMGLLTKAGLRQIRFHDLRHTFASLLLQQGESLTYVKEQMGRHSIQVTVDTNPREQQASRGSSRRYLRLCGDCLESSKKHGGPHKSPHNGKGRV